MKNYNLIFDGYWREVNKQYISEGCGVYLIYTCRYLTEHDTVSLSQLIYIGKADNLKQRIANHSEKEFQKVLKTGETLCYAYALVDKKELNLVENALIFAEKPQCNTKLKDEYSYEDAHFLIEGTCNLMKYTNYSITTRKDKQ